MTWFPSSFSNFKDQITTLTKEVLAEADEERERPRFIPVEKFDRLVKICEEKEEQLCDLQQEVDALKSRLGLSTCSADGDPPPILEDKNEDDKITESGNDDARNANEANLDVALSSSSRPLGNKESVANEEKENTPHAGADYCASLVECSKETLPDLSRSSVQDVFRGIENLDADNLEKAYKQIRRICEERKQACSKTSQSGSHRNGSDETMSNNSEKSDDSLLNDFEVLKSRGSSSKSSTDDFATMSNAPEVEAQPCTQMTRSTSTQSEYEFSLLDTATQTESQLIAQDETDHELADEQVWRELPECSESVRNSVVRLINEYRRLKLLHQTSNQESQTHACEEQESFPEEHLKLKNSTITKHVNDLTAYSKKLENFCSSLSEVSDELVDQDVELSSLYKELKLLRETKDRLQEENTELVELVDQYREAELASQQNIDSQESAYTLLDQRNLFLEGECERMKESVELVTARLYDSERTIRDLDNELEETRQKSALCEKGYTQQIDLLSHQIDALEIEVRDYAQDARLKRDTMQQQLSGRNNEIAAMAANLKTLEEHYDRIRQENNDLKSERAETRSRSTIDEDAHETRRNVVELSEQNQRLQLDLASKNERLEGVAKQLLASLPPNTADVDVVFQSLVSMVSVIDESLDLRLNEMQPWQDMISRLPTLCNCILQWKHSQEEARGNVEKLKTRIMELESQLTDANKLSARLVELEAKLHTLSSERDQVIASLKEKHSETLFYHSELQKFHALYAAETEKNKEYVRLIEESKHKLTENSNVASELERLREHLLNVEQTYTNELVNAEKRIQELQYKLTEYEERIQSMNAVQTSVSVRANQMSESLQKEVKTLTQDKEQLSVALKKCRAELQSHIHEVQNLRSALDLFHRNKDSEVFEATEKLRSQIDKLVEEKRALNETVRSLQASLENEKKLSSERQQLADDLQSKTQTIEEMDKQMLHLRAMLKKAEEEVNVLHANANSDNQFKSDLLKNIFVRYVTSNTDSMRTQTLQILSEVLNFSPQEKRSLGLPGANVHDEAKGSTAHDSSSHSLIDEFIQFMEKESNPREKRKKETSSGSPNILFANSSTLPDVMLPTLSQHSIGHNSTHILKDVLQ